MNQNLENRFFTIIFLRRDAIWLKILPDKITNQLEYIKNYKTTCESENSH